LGHRDLFRIKYSVDGGIVGFAEEIHLLAGMDSVVGGGRGTDGAIGVVHLGYLDDLASVMDPWLNTFVEQYGVECPYCDWPLRPRGDRCPNCGERYALGLRGTVKYALAWGIMLVCLAMNAAPGVFTFLTVGYGGTNDELQDALLRWLEWGGGVSLTAAVFLLVFRRRFCVIPAWVQWVLAAASMVMLAASVMIIIFVR
jgi:hypothetical protein